MLEATVVATAACSVQQQPQSPHKQLSRTCSGIGVFDARTDRCFPLPGLLLPAPLALRAVERIRCPRCTLLPSASGHGLVLRGAFERLHGSATFLVTLLPNL